jgi:hypothetical protein
MNSPFEHYPCQDGTHPEAPMWVAVEHGGGWYRVVDGVHVRRAAGYWTVKFPHKEDLVKLSARAIAGEGDVRYEDGAVLVYLDRTHPPAPPAVRVGQVWVITEEGGTAEVEITSIMRLESGPVVILPSIESDGTIAHQVIAWDPSPINAVMVYDLDGPKVWVPPTWGV